MQRALANFVTGENFHDREVELEEFIRRIHEGAHQLLIAQRRMGKSSLLRETAMRLDKEYQCIYLDFSSDSSAEDAIAKIGAELKAKKSFFKQISSFLSSLMNGIRENLEEVSVYDFGVKLRAVIDKHNWEESGNQIFSILGE